MTTKFKTGDKVQCKNGDTWSNRARVVTVSRVDAYRVFSVETERARAAKDLELAPKPSFKVGDRVICVSGDYVRTLKDLTGTIRSMSASGPNVIEWEGLREGWQDDLVKGNQGWHVPALNLQIVPSPAGSFIVVGVKNGKMQAAASPFIHTSREAAEKEALRLAELVRGDDFRVFSFDHLSTAKAAAVVKPAAELTNVVVR